MEEFKERLKENARRNYVPILQDASLELIENILKEKKPHKILEIGTAVGYSSICFSKYLDKDHGKIITIELNEEMYNIANENILKAGLSDKIETVLSDAETYLKTLNEKFDVIFIDAAKGQYLKYLEQSMRLTDIGSIIIADNVLFKGMVMGDYNEHKHRTAVNVLRKYIKAIKEDERLESTIYDIGDGVAVSYRKK